MSAKPDEAQIGSTQGQTVGEEGGGGGGVGDGVGPALGDPDVGDPALGGPAPGGPPAPVGPAPGGPAPEGGQLFVTKKPHQVLKKTPTSIVLTLYFVFDLKCDIPGGAYRLLKGYGIVL